MAGEAIGIDEFSLHRHLKSVWRADLLLKIPQ